MKKLVAFLIFCLVTFKGSGQENKLLIENVTVIPLHINKVLENKDVVIVHDSGS